MYVAKVFIRKNEKQVYYDVRHYSHLETAIGDVADKSLFDNLEDELYDTLGKCTVFAGSIDTTTNVPDDFEFRFENGVVVYVGTIMIEEEKSR